MNIYCQHQDGSWDSVAYHFEVPPVSASDWYTVYIEPQNSSAASLSGYQREAAYFLSVGAN